MHITLKNVKEIPAGESVVLLHKKEALLRTSLLTRKEKSYIAALPKDKSSDIQAFNRFGSHLFVLLYEEKPQGYQTVEQCRLLGSKVVKHIKELDIRSVTIASTDPDVSLSEAVAEGVILAGYQFNRFFQPSTVEKRALSFSVIGILHRKATKERLDVLSALMEYTMFARDLVNLPANYLNAEGLSMLLQERALPLNIKVTVFNRKKIEALKMGGILSVNRGSVDAPTFTILEYKPEGHRNEKPLVLVGKGVTFDTGGMNIKTGSYMTGMKSDMSGAAAAASALFAIAAAKIPQYVIVLIPATDNRVQGNALVPGDVITMHDGTHVEVLNTDAEGRLIMADALSYAKNHDPQLVLDIATLTGSAMRAIGDLGVVGMHHDAGKFMEQLKESGEQVYERVVELPLWEEYKEMIQSEIADIANIGGANAGAITAGKFLQHFTDYPFIHLDIAGAALRDKAKGYLPTGATGVGVRLVFDFIRRLAEKK